MSTGPRLAISVVIPCFNAAPYLDQALGSVLSQSLAPDEVILVDDGSTDASLDVAAAYAGRITVLRQSNAGAPAARNLGIRRCWGDVVVLLDADDWMHPDALRHQMNRLVETGADIAYGALLQTDRDGRPRGTAAIGRMPGSIMVRRDVFDRVGLFDERLKTAELLDWMARADDAGVVSASHEHLTYYRRVHGDNMMLNSPGQNADQLAVLRSALQRRRALAFAGTGGSIAGS